MDHIVDSPLTIEHSTTGPDDNPAEFVNFGDLDGDNLNVVGDKHGLFFQTSSPAGAQFAPADAATVATTILKLVAPPAGELALPLLARAHVEAARRAGDDVTNDLILRTAAGEPLPSNEALLVAYGVLAITMARLLGAKTPAEAVAMTATIPGMPGTRYNLNDTFSPLS